MNVEENDLKTTPYKKATEMYIEVIVAESVDEILNEAEPNLRTKEYAFMKFMNAPNTQDHTDRDLLQEFESTTNGFLQADSSLL